MPEGGLQVAQLEEEAANSDPSEAEGSLLPNLAAAMVSSPLSQFKVQNNSVKSKSCKVE